MTLRLVAAGALLLGSVAVLVLSHQLSRSQTDGAVIKDTPPATSSESDIQTDSASSTEPFRFDIADSDAERQRGFSGRAFIPHNYGLLFVFPTAGRHAFWMKDMLVPIDIIWLSDTGVILGIESAVEPASYPALFYPPQPVRLVLETAAGEAAAQGWDVGTMLSLPLQFE